MHYTSEKNIQILIALLKEHNIRKIIVSPGSTNVSFVGSIQSDPFFEIYSCVDERSAAYIACGMANEAGEPVCISCTGATSSRNYMPGLTEAFYRKLPVIAITSSQHEGRIGQLIPQVTDRTVGTKDIVKLSVNLQMVSSDEDLWSCELKVNNALLETRRNGGGPVHINLQTSYSKDFSVKHLPEVRKITRYSIEDEMPTLQGQKVAIYIGSHSKMSTRLQNSIDDFCELYDAAVFCDHTSGYYGQYKLLHEIVSYQENHLRKDCPDVMIHLGEMSGAYGGSWRANKIWRVNEDGEIRDAYKLLTDVFEMPEVTFFEYYVSLAKNDQGIKKRNSNYFVECLKHERLLREKKVDLPFSLFWTAKQTAPLIPSGSRIHFAILNALRAWNFYELPNGVESMCNVGGFGIDGCMSSLIGASFVDSTKLCFLIIGDLAFFYDMNVLGNRHIKGNVRIMLINNGEGTQFTAYNSMAQIALGDEVQPFIAAKGHYASKSEDLVKHYATDLNFEYHSARNKEEFMENIRWFVDEDVNGKSKIFEIFTDPDDESNALKKMLNLEDAGMLNISRKVKNSFTLKKQ